MRATTESQLRFSQGSSKENSMLKINFSQTAVDEKWILHGRLSGPWVDELRTCWQVNHSSDAGRACIVDLNEVTFIDKSGEQLLRMLAKDGAQFTASGTYIKHVN
jgi:anti-anti-sigma regulatory factor